MIPVKIILTTSTKGTRKVAYVGTDGGKADEAFAKVAADTAFERVDYIRELEPLKTRRPAVDARRAKETAAAVAAKAKADAAAEAAAKEARIADLKAQLAELEGPPAKS